MADHIKTFINLPVKNLNAAITFFTKLGFTFNSKFTDQNATCMIIGPDTFVMLLAGPFFRTFTKKEIADASKTTEVIIALAVDSREKVDVMVKTALASGGSPSNEPSDQGWMYGWGFQDPDNHVWEVLYMDQTAMKQE